MVRVGCCGFAASQARAFASLDAVEIQQTFYEPPRRATLEKWRRAAPPNFAFTVKCFQLVTHERTSPTYRRRRRLLPADAQVGHLRDTPAVHAAWHETIDCALALDAAFVLVQTPPSFIPSVEHVGRLENLSRWPRPQTVGLAFEPRGATWDHLELDRLCARLGLLRACDPLSTTPPPPTVQPTAYFRLHGRTGYSYRYSETHYEALLATVRRYREAWVFFNNVSMWEDACRFRRFLHTHRG